MFEYTFREGGTIETPFVENFEDIKKEIVQMKDCIINKSTYPNGVYVEVYQYSDRLEIKSNTELIDNGDGTYRFKL